MRSLLGNAAVRIFRQGLHRLPEGLPASPPSVPGEETLVLDIHGTLMRFVTEFGKCGIRPPLIPRCGRLAVPTRWLHLESARTGAFPTFAFLKLVAIRPWTIQLCGRFRALTRFALSPTTTWVPTWT